ncbi:hypothetical protein BD413DRAFT_6575 [Trametes elegans]|nr:hypothetical protein BD413DRAFT_6575 [Trametes elegans]
MVVHFELLTARVSLYHHGPEAPNDHCACHCSAAIAARCGHIDTRISSAQMVNEHPILVYISVMRSPASARSYPLARAVPISLLHWRYTNVLQLTRYAVVSGTQKMYVYLHTGPLWCIRHRNNVSDFCRLPTESPCTIMSGFPRLQPIWWVRL